MPIMFLELNVFLMISQRLAKSFFCNTFSTKTISFKGFLSKCDQVRSLYQLFCQNLPWSFLSTIYLVNVRKSPVWGNPQEFPRICFLLQRKLLLQNSFFWRVNHLIYKLIIWIILDIRNGFVRRNEVQWVFIF